ncbi:MAG: amino acid permease [Clostridiales Family XIII bacterium]|nr:amino acid permease [Clostridiales Family XIII bacterium]
MKRKMDVLRKKSIEQTLEMTTEEGHRLKRNLGPLDLAFLAVSVCVGAGIFSVSTKVMTQNAGPSTIVSFVLAAFVCGLAAMCYAEFSTSIPVSGSAYSYSYAALGEIFAWIIGWDLILELFLATAVIAKYWAIYVSDALNVFGIHSTLSFHIGDFKVDYGAAIVILFFTVLLSIGTKLSARITNTMTCIKIGIVLVIIVAGFGYFSWENLTPFIPEAIPSDGSTVGILTDTLWGTITGFGGGHFGVGGMFAGAAIICFAYVGFDTVATAAEETKNPKRNVPIGIILGLGIVTVLYVSVAFVTCGMVNYVDLSEFAASQGREVSLATAFLYHGANWQSAVIAVGAAVGLTTVIMVELFGVSRIIFAMSRDGLFPEKWSKTSDKSMTPVGITVVIGIVAALVATLTSVDELADMINIGTLSAFVMVSIGVIFIRKNAKEHHLDQSKTFKVPLFPVLPIVSAVLCFVLMLNLTNVTWLRFLVWLLVGFIIYFTYSHRHAKINHDEVNKKEA